jgi:hypothetical protein
VTPINAELFLLTSMTILPTRSYPNDVSTTSLTAIPVKNYTNDISTVYLMHLDLAKMECKILNQTELPDLDPQIVVDESDPQKFVVVVHGKRSHYLYRGRIDRESKLRINGETSAFDFKDLNHESLKLEGGLNSTAKIGGIFKFFVGVQNSVKFQRNKTCNIPFGSRELALQADLFFVVKFAGIRMPSSI